MNFGTNLATYRKNKGLSQEELGEALGVSRQTIYTWESNISSPSMDKLISIADFFDCSVDSLVKGDAETSFSNSEQPKNICKGDKQKISDFFKAFAFKIAIATFIILIGISAMIILEPIIGDYTIAVFFAPLIAAVGIYIYSGVSYSAFFTRDENENYKSLFTREEKATELSRFGKILAAAVGGILLGVLLLCLIAISNENHSEIAVSLFLAIVGISVFFIIYNAIPLSKYYGENEEGLNEEDKKRFARAEKINSILWLITVAVYLLMGFLGDLWHPGWIVFIIAAFASGIVEMLCGVKKNN